MKSRKNIYISIATFFIGFSILNIAFTNCSGQKISTQAVVSDESDDLTILPAPNEQDEQTSDLGVDNKLVEPTKVVLNQPCSYFPNWKGESASTARCIFTLDFKKSKFVFNKRNPASAAVDPNVELAPAFNLDLYQMQVSKSIWLDQQGQYVRVAGSTLLPGAEKLINSDQKVGVNLKQLLVEVEAQIADEADKAQLDTAYYKAYYEDGSHKSVKGRAQLSESLKLLYFILDGL